MVSYLNSRGTFYYLHGKIATLKGGQQQQIYYFAKTIGENAVPDRPNGYDIIEGKTGLVFLRKIKVLTG